jgi:hypothetical protein
MKRFKIFLPLFAALALALPLCSNPGKADVPVLQASGNLQASGTSSSCVQSTGATGSCVVVHCPQGQSSAVIYVPAGSSLSGTVTPYVAPDVNGVAGVYGAPLWVTTPGGTTNVSSLSSFPGTLYVTLGSSQWVEAVLTTASSGNATTTITCSSAVARAAGGGVGPSGPPGPTGSPGATGSPGPAGSAAPTICPSAGTGIGVSGTYPCTVNLATPVSVANGGSGTAAPAPTSSSNCSVSGSWPSNTFACPTPQTQYASSGATSLATGTTGNTYVVLSTISGTTGVSHGPNGNWLATVTMPLAVTAQLGAEYVYGCVTTTGTLASTVDTVKGAGASNCLTASTGSVGGTPAFGDQTLTGAAGAGLSAVYIGHFTIANSTAFNFTGEGAGSTGTSITIFGFINVVLEQN